MAFTDEEVQLQKLHFPFIPNPAVLFKSNFDFHYSWKKEWLSKARFCHYKTKEKETLPVAFYTMKFHEGCQHLLGWCGLGQCIRSNEFQLEPESKVLKKQNNQNIQFDADFGA